VPKIDESTIILGFKSTFSNAWPQCQIKIDDIIIDHIIEEELTECVVTLPESSGDYTLEIIHSGKTPKDTTLDNQGNIIQDRTLELLFIKFMDVELLDFYKYSGTFFPDPHLNAPEKIVGGTIMGFNGTFKLVIDIPFYEYYKHKQFEHNKEYETINRYDDYSRSILDKDMLNKLIKECKDAFNS